MRTYRYEMSSILFVLLMTLPVINYFFAEILWAFGLRNPISDYIYALVYAIGLYSVVRRINIFKIGAILVFVFLLLYTAIITPQAIPEITKPTLLESSVGLLIFDYFPIFLLVSDKDFNYENSFSLLSKVALIPILLMIVAYALQAIITQQGLHEYMTFAYTALPMIMIVLYYSWSSSGQVLGKVVSIIAAISILFGGCRGALLSLIVFIILSVIFYRKSRFLKILTIVVGGLIIYNLSPLLQFLGGQLNSFGVESRIFEIIDARTMAESESRIEIYNKALSLIDVMGHGIYSDRVLLEHLHEASYCHNWILEFLVDFGWILGVLLALLLIIMIIKQAFRLSSNANIVEKFMLFFSISMLGVKFMLSNSYLNSSEVAVIFGWLIYYSRKKRTYAIP